MSKGHVLIDGLCFPEGPRWHDNRLFFSDMQAELVIAVDESGNREDIVRVPGLPSGLGWTPEGQLLVVSMTDQRLLRLEADGTLAQVADLSSLASNQCNDMVVDSRGRAYIGNFGYDLHENAEMKMAELILVERDGAAAIVASELAFPNGAVITPDGQTLIIAETMGGRLTAFDVAPDGRLSKRRVWAELEGVYPDGICLDAEGCVWVASPTKNCALRVAQGGRITDQIDVETAAFACMLGGAHGRTLFVCTAASTDPKAARALRSGRIEAFEVLVPQVG